MVMIWVVRHGRTTANASGLLLGRADPELDDVGLEQARQIARVLPPDAVAYTSPLRRTAATAAAYSGRVTSDDRLLELDYGEFDLRPVNDIPAETWTRWRSDPDFRPPGGETFLELDVRLGSFLDEVSSNALDDARLTEDGADDDGVDDIVLFTHVSPIKAAVAWALGTTSSISWRTHVAQASITRIAVTNRGPSLHLFNATDHLGSP